MKSVMEGTMKMLGQAHRCDLSSCSTGTVPNAVFHTAEQKSTPEVFFQPKHAQAKVASSPSTTNESRTCVGRHTSALSPALKDI